MADLAPQGTCLTVTDPPAHEEKGKLIVPAQARSNTLERGFVLDTGEDVPDTIQRGDIVLYCRCSLFQVGDTKIIEAACVKAIEREPEFKPGEA